MTPAQRNAQIEYNEAVKTGKPPARDIINSRGNKTRNPAYTKYQAKRQAASKSIKDSGVKIISPGTLSRSVHQKVSGKISTPTNQFNPEMRNQIIQYQLNQSLFAGDITPAAYAQRTGQLTKETAKLQQERTIELGRKAARKHKSETVKQDEARSTAALHGVAIGTINDGKGSISNNSSVANNIKISNFVDSQKIPKTQAQRENRVKVTTPDGKERIFKNQETADKFIKRVDGNYKVQTIPKQPDKNDFRNFLQTGQEPIRAVVGSLEYNFGDNTQDFKSYLFDENTPYGAANVLRYSDAVDSGQVEKPKGLENILYYSSRGLRPIYNIPLGLMGDKNIQSTLASTIIDVPIDLVTKGKTKTHDPIGDFVRKDPFATLVELPGEGLMWVSGAKAVDIGGKVVSRYSPLLYQSKKIVTDKKPETIYRGLTWKDKPLLGVQQGKFTKGFDSSKVADSFSKIKTKSLGRDGIEAGVGSGIETELIYSKKTLSELVRRGIIPEIAKQRALQSKTIVKASKGITNEVGSFGDTPIEGLTNVQAKSLLTKVVQGQKSGDVDLVHGSTALKPQLGDKITKEAGSSVKLGDVDIHPTGKTLTEKAKKADKLIQGFAADFPLSPGQRLSIKNLNAGESTNRAIELSGGSLKEPKKVLEVVLKSTDESEYGIAQGNKILGERIPFNKSVTAKDIPIKLHTADYQLLTNIKQVTSFQKGTSTPLDVYPSSGRTKDIVRSYWNVKAKALFKGGDKGKQVDAEAEKFRKLYPGIEFTDYTPEKVLLSSSRTSASSITSKTPTPLRPTSVKEVESKQSSKQSMITSKKPSIIHSKIPSKIQSKISSVKISSKVQSMLSSKSRNLTSRKPSRISNSIKPSSNTKPLTPNKPTSTITSKKPVSTPGKPTTRPASRILSKPPQTKTIINYRNIRRPIGPIAIITKGATKKTKGTKKESHNFLGNTHAGDLLGFRSKKKDIDVGDKRTKKLYNDDLLNTKRKHKKSVNKNTMLLVGKSKMSLM